MERPLYQRVLLKLSGEALMGGQPFGIDPEMVRRVAGEIREVARLGVRLGVVIGGGNIFRGVEAHARGMDRVAADHMGMLATVINVLSLRGALEALDVPVKAFSALAVTGVVEAFSQREALHHLARGRVVLFGGGTGNPFFTTDTAATLRALEMGAQVLLKATKVDGVYDRDPVRFPEARRFAVLSFDEVLARSLNVMDAAAVSLCRDHRLPIVVFNLRDAGNICKAVCGEPIGTVVKE